ncbi:CAP domain-containing protein [Nonomuraea sp. NPDC046570]|uniref:CAP domain-containing protein n=1 Tax=Nonomuraea sp. NPDC046570 TaxID=3155255 RepID=UPI0033CDF23D
MRRQLQALACLGSLAALSTPVTAAHAATQSAACQVTAAKPYVDAKGMIRGTGARSGCDDSSRLRVRILQSRPGPDRTLKSASRQVVNGEIVAGVRCTDTPRRYYVLALDYQGNVSRSPVTALSCAPTTPTPTPTTPAPTPSTPPGDGGTGSAVEEEVVRLTNQARTAGGCKPLAHDAKLHAAAKGHSADMAAKGYFSHTSQDGRSPGDRIKATGFSPIRAWAENIAMGQRTAASVVQGWLNSPGHKANIMNCDLTLIGVGHDPKGPHWTQVFARH